MKEIATVVYTHSDYSDLWVACFSRLRKHYTELPIHIITDSVTDEFCKQFNLIPILYNDQLPYNKRLAETLPKIGAKHILFMHEDMFLYDQVDKSMFNRAEWHIHESHIHYIRLIKSGIVTTPVYAKDNLYTVTSSDICFSITPTIWKTQTLLEVCNASSSNTIWSFEVEGDSYMKQRGHQGLYVFDALRNKKRGLHHYDSSVFPHMCSGIFKGKWNTEYRVELEDLWSEYNINPESRGLFYP